MSKIYIPKKLREALKQIEVKKNNNEYVEHTPGKPERRREKGFNNYFYAGR